MDKKDLSLVKGVGKISAERLQAGGLTTIYRLSKSSVEKIAESTGFPPVRAALIKAAAQELLEAAEPEAPQETLPTAVAEPEEEKAKKKKKSKKAKKKKAGKKNKKKPDGKKEKKGKKGKKDKKGKKKSKKKK